MSESVLQRNNVRQAGTGVIPMVFSHGFGCDQNMWRFVAPAFEADFKTVLFDHVGAGRSDIAAYDPRKYATLDGYADDVVELGGDAGLEERRLRRSLGQCDDRCSGVTDGARECSASSSSSGHRHATSTMRAMLEDLPPSRSRSYSRGWPTTTWAGRLPWRRRSWAILIGRNSGRS